MIWLRNFITSSIGKKMVMSLTGLFLITFLVVHLLGNLQLLAEDDGESFNRYTYFMTHNPMIKIISYGLYFFILLHTIQGILIAVSNRKAKGQKYAINTHENGTWMSKNMAILGTLIFAFICIHMGDFWYKMHYTDKLPMVKYEGYDNEVKDLYVAVKLTFSQTWIVVVYIVGMIVMALHLLHGFQSAFTTLGLRHKKYTPIINFLGIMYSLIIPIGFAIIPLWFLIKKTGL